MFIMNAYKNLFLSKVVVMAENKRLVEFVHLNKLKSMYLNFISSHTEFGQSWINICCDAYQSECKISYLPQDSLLYKTKQIIVFINIQPSVLDNHK